jgi:hypothetical protein
VARSALDLARSALDLARHDSRQLFIGPEKADSRLNMDKIGAKRVRPLL